MCTKFENSGFAGKYQGLMSEIDSPEPWRGRITLPSHSMARAGLLGNSA